MLDARRAGRPLHLIAPPPRAAPTAGECRDSCCSPRPRARPPTARRMRSPDLQARRRDPWRRGGSARLELALSPCRDRRRGRARCRASRRRARRGRRRGTLARSRPRSGRALRAGFGAALHGAEEVLDHRVRDVDVGDALQAAPGRVGVDLEHQEPAVGRADQIDAGIVGIDGGERGGGERRHLAAWACRGRVRRPGARW